MFNGKKLTDYFLLCCLIANFTIASLMSPESFMLVVSFCFLLAVISIDTATRVINE